ncbi:hypothetical protein Csa_018257 [Cucumis sativus]|uniref:Uncharacterized protein n=1 Tax=Cucumis sativus TaxID=3659 RepID=A0A0A0KFZ9_CUCSA|nr:hypothetical protein Csa_018257 [Cucumis sativus]
MANLALTHFLSLIKIALLGLLISLAVLLSSLAIPSCSATLSNLGIISLAGGGGAKEEVQEKNKKEKRKKVAKEERERSTKDRKYKHKTQKKK